MERLFQFITFIIIGQSKAHYIHEYASYKRRQDLCLLLNSGREVLPTYKCKVLPILKEFWIRILPHVPPLHLQTFNFMIAFASFFTIDKAIWWWTFPKCLAIALSKAPYFGNVTLIGLYHTQNFPSITIPKESWHFDWLSCHKLQAITFYLHYFLTNLLVSTRSYSTCISLATYLLGQVPVHAQPQLSLAQ